MSGDSHFSTGRQFTTFTRGRRACKSHFPWGTILGCILQCASLGHTGLVQFPQVPHLPAPGPPGSPPARLARHESLSGWKLLATHLAPLLSGGPHQHFQGGRQRAVVVGGLLLQAARVPDPLQLGRVLHIDTLCREGGCGRDQGSVSEPTTGSAKGPRRPRHLGVRVTCKYVGGLTPQGLSWLIVNSASFPTLTCHPPGGPREAQSRKGPQV